MSVAELSALHGRYIRLTDRFKSSWTFHQYVSGVFRSLLADPLPYTIDFQKTYEEIKTIGGTLTPGRAPEALKAINAGEMTLGRIAASLLEADDRITPSVLRRFFEQLKKQDETIVHNLIKFYLYSDAVEGDRRDKLDYLLTRIGERSLAPHAPASEAAEFRERVAGLVGVLRIAVPPDSEIAQIIRAIRSMQEEIEAVGRFDDLTGKNLLRNARTFKHRIGDLYFHPDVVVAIVGLNVAARNKFLALYQEEEKRVLEDADKLMMHGRAIERNFGETNPDLVDEITRFREYKDRFDEQREQSNVKHDIFTQLKSSITNILAQLDRGLGDLDAGMPDEIPEPLVEGGDEDLREIAVGFDDRDIVLPQLRRIASAIEHCDMMLTPEQMSETKRMRELRVEPWEIAAYEKLIGRRPADSPEDDEDLWRLYLRAAALRVRLDEEATAMAMTSAAGITSEEAVLERAKQSLDLAKELDEAFGALLEEAVYYTNAKMLRQLYRSRFRLLRCYSGLWLIYDRQQ